MPQIKSSSCGHFKASWDTHLTCFSCSNCSREHKCAVFSTSTEETWKKVDRRQTYKFRKMTKKQRVKQRGGAKDKSKQAPKSVHSESSGRSRPDNTRSQGGGDVSHTPKASGGINQENQSLSRDLSVSLSKQVDPGTKSSTGKDQNSGSAGAVPTSGFAGDSGAGTVMDVSAGTGKSNSGTENTGTSGRRSGTASTVGIPPVNDNSSPTRALRIVGPDGLDVEKSNDLLSNSESSLSGFSPVDIRQGDELSSRRSHIWSKSRTTDLETGFVGLKAGTADQHSGIRYHR